jgi:hypothetical protein
VVSVSEVAPESSFPSRNHAYDRADSKGARDNLLSGRSPRHVASEHTKLPDPSMLTVGGAVAIGDSIAHTDCTPPIDDPDALSLLIVISMFADAPVGSMMVSAPEVGTAALSDEPVPATSVPSEKAANEAGFVALPT